MTILDHRRDFIPSGFRKVLYFHYPLAILICAVVALGLLMLFSVSGGVLGRWSIPQGIRFGLGFLLMVTVSFSPIQFWRRLSTPSYVLALALLIYVDLFGSTGKGAQRWIDLGFINLQPSELMKITLIMVLAQYYAWLDFDRVSRPIWLLPPVILTAIPVVLVLQQPDLGTALLLAAGAGVLMFLAGVNLWYFVTLIAGFGTVIYGVLQSQGTPYQILKDYQYSRINTFIDPTSDPLGAGYHLTQSKIALGSGGYSGRGFMQGTQSRLNFLPEKHTDFIFITLGEEFGFLGGISLLILYILILACCYISAVQNKSRFSTLLILGIAATFFFYFAVNMLMVMGLAPVVGVPLPLVSYGGSAMLVLLGAFGLVQSAHIHRAR